MIRVLVVDDHEMFAESITRVLSAESDIEVAATAGTVTDAVRLAGELRPDVVVLDVHLPDGDGIEAARRIKAQDAATHIVFLTGSADEATMRLAVDAGCSGLVTKTKALSQLIDAVRVAAAGNAYLTPDVLAVLMPRLGSRPWQLGSDLTDREREVLELMSDGLSNQAMATQMFLSVNTVRNHVQGILTKLNAHSRLEAVAIARRNGILGPR